MDTVYIETTVVGSIAGRLHPDPLVAARQTATRKWWATAQQTYERLAVISGLELLDTSDPVDDLADELIATGAVPPSHPRDAFHIAIAAVNGVQYLVTWNFKHIANPMLQNRIASVCRDSGFEPPVICTPEQLLEAEDDSDAD